MDTAKANAEECFHLGLKPLEPCTDIFRSLGVLPLSLLLDPYHCVLEGKKKKSTSSKAGWVTGRLARLKAGCLASSHSQSNAEGTAYPKASKLWKPHVSLCSYHLLYRLGRKIGCNFETKEGSHSASQQALNHFPS